jgi:hypothetical protein
MVGCSINRCGSGVLHYEGLKSGGGHYDIED